MMRSLSSGVAGLRSHQTKMDVIGNNIANVSTAGFKASRTTFADVYYQNLGGASRGTSGVQGGKNPTQIGYGAAVATIDVANSVSSKQSTDFALDVFIAGDGFIVSKDVNGRSMYTRLGKLDFDSAGNLVDGSGNLVQGFPMKPDGTPEIGPDGTISSTDLRSITGDPAILAKLKGISISPSGLIVGTLEGDKTIKTEKVPDFINPDSITINKDSNFLGDVKLNIGALPTNTEVAQWFAGTSASGATPYAPVVVTNLSFGDVGLPKADGSSVSYSFSVNGTTFKLTVTDKDNKGNDDVYEGIVQEDGSVVLKSKTSGKTAMSFTVDKKPASDTKIDANPGDMETSMGTMKYQVTTRDKGDNIVKLPENNNGEAQVFTGQLENLGGITMALKDPTKYEPVSIVIGKAVPGDSILYPIGNIAIAKFPNPNGMQEEGSSYFTESANSGSPIFVKPGVDSTGTLIGSSLEMSNVDVSKEFTDMITTQRGFQANSRIITVSDTMLEELVNLKR